MQGTVRFLTKNNCICSKLVHWPTVYYPKQVSSWPMQKFTAHVILGEKFDSPLHKDFSHGSYTVHQNKQSFPRNL